MAFMTSITLIDDFFVQLQERLNAGLSGPAPFKVLQADMTDYLDRAPRKATLETLQKFGVRIGTSFSSYLRTFRVIVAGVVERSGP